MEIWLHINWREAFAPYVPVANTILQGWVVYRSLVLLFRLGRKIEGGTVGVRDLLVVVLTAEAAHSAMADDYKSIPNGLVLVVRMIFWVCALDWFAVRPARSARQDKLEFLPFLHRIRLLAISSIHAKSAVSGARQRLRQRFRSTSEACSP